jgi:lipid II:glycine glycyltransferase (peptidoglycan interpeptide bridge formation enzyme)
VATSLWLVLHDRAVFVDGASVRDTQFTGVNHHLFHHILHDLYKQGVRHFDFGSGPEGKSPAGLIQFKEGWGAKPATRTEVIYRRPWFHLLRKFI